jgi:hypothetical protein
VHHRHLIEATGCLLGLRILLRLLFELLHQAMVLHLHLFCVTRPALDGVLYHCLALELLRPTRQGNRSRMTLMRRIPWTGRKQPWRRHQAACQQCAMQHERQALSPLPLLLLKRPHTRPPLLISAIFGGWLLDD